MTTLERLINKAKSVDSFDSGCMFPCLKKISKLLSEYGIEHQLCESKREVEYGSRNRKFIVYGKRLTIYKPKMVLDTTEKYYSYKTVEYAREIVELIERKQDLTKAAYPSPLIEG